MFGSTGSQHQGSGKDTINTLGEDKAWYKVYMGRSR